MAKGPFATNVPPKLTFHSIISRLLINCVLFTAQLDANSTCFTVEAERSIKVDKLKPALVKVYDYYKVEESGRVFYLPEAPENALTPAQDKALASPATANSDEP